MDLSFVVSFVVIFGLLLGLLAFGFASMKRRQKYAKSVMSAAEPVKMVITHINEQKLWFNSVHSPGYRIDLKPADASRSPIEQLKVDPADNAAHKEWGSVRDKLSAQPGDGRQPSDGSEPVADVYFDDKGEPVAVSVQGAVAWKVAWWGDA